MPTVHVEIQLLLRGPLVINISKERPSRGTLIAGIRYNHTHAHPGSSHAVDLVVDESLAGVEFASSLTIDEEDIGAFDHAAAVDFGRGFTIREGGFAKACCEEELVVCAAYLRGFI